MKDKHRSEVDFYKEVIIKTIPNKEILQELFSYDESSPSCLRWIKTPKHGPTKAGDIAGTLNSRGYWSVSINSKDFLVHRVIWNLLFEDIPDGLVIDHLDGDTTNNKKNNLRIVDIEVNLRNQKKYKNNSSGHTGIKIGKSSSNGRNEVYSFIAQVNIEKNKRKTKSFSWLKYGKQEALRLAIEWRNLQILNMESGKYTDRHGKIA